MGDYKDNSHTERQHSIRENNSPRGNECLLNDVVFFKLNLLIIIVRDKKIGDIFGTKIVR